MDNSLTKVASICRKSAQYLAVLTTEDKDRAINAIALALESAKAEIIAANGVDCQNAASAGIPKPLYNRLKLDEAKLNDAITGVRDVANLSDPVGAISIHRQLDDNLILKRVTCPLGVLGVIFEARPDAAIQISTLAIKSGNGVILKCGQEAIHSCQAILKAIHKGLAQTNISPEVVQLLTTREETLELLKLDRYVDLIIPRGSNSFVRFVQNNTHIPVLGHAEGICHLYVDAAANITKAVEIAIDAKTQYPAACNSIETLLVHTDIAAEFLPLVATALQQRSVELRGDEGTRKIIDVGSASDTDWETEYSDLVLSIKIVDSLADATSHINYYGSGHTDAIATEDSINANIFLSQVNSAGVYHNCSTRFADGFRYGFGAEVGISTQKLPPRGPVGLEGLVTYKYQLVGDGHIAATYTGVDGKAFKHQDLD